ncbi:hypothetical protein AHAT_21200 [Agarivorans sp. Toyoura001]|uniref:hypothetical protein n=1 Tax=Agarivorans sp. Toyoura001 TaxID=2283141 RepID=UPI0010DA1BEB|nr:hypothetical protein [Agarivorans sp. Toyoura001]GDY26230.1 hypothetical protein AHAT_21200 [Agarivorans sp. Toyoura001]
MPSPTLITANYSDIPALSQMFIAAYANNETMQAALRSNEIDNYAHDSYGALLWVNGE